MLLLQLFEKFFVVRRLFLHKFGGMVRVLIAGDLAGSLSCFNGMGALVIVGNLAGSFHISLENRCLLCIGLGLVILVAQRHIYLLNLLLELREGRRLVSLAVLPVGLLEGLRG